MIIFYGVLNLLGLNLLINATILENGLLNILGGAVYLSSLFFIVKEYEKE